MNVRKIIFVNRFFYPDQSATSRLLTDLAVFLAREGFSVSVITTRGLYDDPDANLAAEDEYAGVIIHRVYRPRFSRSDLWRRALDYAGMYVAFAAAALRYARHGDCVVSKTDPPLLSILFTLLARLKHFAHVNWLQDIYPEVAVAVGLRWLKPLTPALCAARNASLRAARLNVVIGMGMQELLRAAGAKRVEIIQNWCDDEAITPIPLDKNEFRKQWGLTDKFVVGYSGNLGRAHEYATLLEAAAKLADEDEIRFLFIGGGHLLARLKEEVAARRLTEKFIFLPYQPQESLAQSLSAPDVHWLSQPATMEGLILPSKFYGVAAAGRPTIIVGDPAGELAQLVERHDCGVAVATGDAERLAELIRAIQSDPQRRDEMGANARQMLKEKFARRQALAKWRALLESL